MTRATWRLPVVALAVGGLLLSGCGGGGSDSEDQAAAADTAVAPEETEPVRGGQLVVGLQSEIDGFLPYSNRFGPSSFQIASSIYDPLVAWDEDEQARPFLLESIEPNDDFTAWTLRLRSGIKFHDGEDFDADAVVLNLQKSKDSSLSGAALDAVESIEAVDPSTVKVTMSSPWALFPAALTSQIGYMVAPAQINANDGQGDQKNPLGTGPFKPDTWVPGEQFTTVINVNYWRTDAQGRQLPFVEKLVFKPYADAAARLTALEDGDLDLMHTNDPVQISNLSQSPGELGVLVDKGSDELAIVFDTQNGAFGDERLRLAAAHALDRQALIDELLGGQVEIANGPFPADSVWGDADGYPAYDPDEARALIQAYTEENGSAPAVELSVINDPTRLAYGQYIQEAWEEVGFDVTLNAIPEASFTLDLVSGTSSAYVFNYWQDVDPDTFYVFLSSEGIAPEGQIALNFARWSNGAIDEAFAAARATDDQAARAEQYQKVWDELAANVPVFFVYHTQWAYVWGPQVHGVGQGSLPDGSPALPTHFGVTSLADVWKG